MLTIQKSKSNHKGKCAPNVLPCRLNHSGAVDISKRYWDPRLRENTRTSYFRGRKLYARRLRVPEGYKGVVLMNTDRVLPPKTRDEIQRERELESGGEGKMQGQGREEGCGEEEDEEEEAKEVETKILEEVGTFGELDVWGHEMLADEADPYVRGIEEWIGFAGAIHAWRR